MRIVLPTLYRNVGGSTKVLLASAAALGRRHETIVRGPLDAATSHQGLDLPPSIEGPAAKALAAPVLAVAMLKESLWLARARPDLLHIHDEPSLYAYGPAARALGIPVVWHVHMREGQGATLRMRTALASAKIFVSDFMVGPDQPLPYAVIRNPVSFVPGIRAGRQTGAPLRLSVIGSLSANKNQDLAIAAWRELRSRGVDATLTLFGTELQPGYRAFLEGRIAAAGLEDLVALAGHVPLELALDRTDVLLAPSRSESQHLAVLEALGAGLPVVASPIPAHWSIARLVSTRGMVIAEGSPEEFAAAAVAVRADPGSPAAVAAAYGEDRFAAELLDFIDAIPRTRAR
jgi:glycosyltransferase involved in cell wall biosynthesis